MNLQKLDTVNTPPSPKVGLLSDNLPDLDNLRPEELPALLEECEKAADLIERIRQRAKNVIGGGRPVRGWGIETINRHTLIDHEAAFARIWTDYGRDVAVRCIKLSLLMAAAAVAGSAEISQGQAKARLSRTLSALIVEAVSQRLWRQRE